MAVIQSIISWVMGNYQIILSVVAGLIAFDEVLIQVFGATESSILMRLKEILVQVSGVVLKVFPSNNSGSTPPPPAA